MKRLDETLEIFFSETDDLLKSAEESLLSLESTPGSSSDLEQLFRSVHTMKSSAAMVGYVEISEYAHLLENLLERLRSGRLTVTNRLITYLLDATDFIRSMVENVSRGGPAADPEVLSERKGRAKRYLGIQGVTSEDGGDVGEPEAASRRFPEEKAAEQPRFYKIDLNFAPRLFYSGQDPLLILHNLSEQGEFVRVVPDLLRLPDFESYAMYNLYISWQIVMKTNRCYADIEDVFMFVMEDHDIRIEDVTDRYRHGIDVEVADKKLGEVLLEKSQITHEQLSDALGKQKMLGQILVEQGRVEREDVDTAVAMQLEGRTVFRKTTIRVDVEKIDHLVNLGEEIGVGLSKMRKFFEQGCSANQMSLVESLDNLLKVNREFQERVARVRMFPLEGTFRRFQRMARDLAFQQKKEVNVVLTGPDTELDKEVIEHFTDPMKHLVRNCLDHGIETPQERVAKGKPPAGTVELKAYQRGGRVFVEILEDGRGIDLEGIRKKAVHLGWLRADDAIDDEALLKFIFKPGFSMSPKVTEVSGRGVGMDVVKTELKNLGGTIEVRTEQDKGTRFILCLPLTSALMEALHLSVQGNSYLVPIQTVVGTEKFSEKLVKQMGQDERVYFFRGDYVPLLDISRVLHRSSPASNGQEKLLVFVDTGTKVFGIPVDQLLEPRQIIVKSLETHYRNVRGLAGASILADGSVSLVLDLLSLEEIFFKNSTRGDGAHENGEERVQN